MTEIEHVSGNEAYFAKFDDMSSSYEASDLQAALEEIEKIDVDTIHQSLRCGVLRRKADYLYLLSNYQEKKEKRVEMIELAYNFALKGHNADSTDFECCKVLCSTLGRLAEESPLRKKVDYGFKFKEYLDKAISIDNADFETLHMRGRFCYTVANLSLIEKMAAKVLGTVPDVSYNDALKDLIKADEILPNVAENQLFIGKSYLGLSDYKNAKHWLELTAGNESNIAIEQEYVDEARELLKDKKFKNLATK